MAHSTPFTEVAMSHQTDSPYVRTQQYTRGAGRLFQQPAVPMQAEWGLPHVDPVTSATHVFSEGEFVPYEFFKKIGPEWFVPEAEGKEWKYCMRREAQKILPFLYLGPYASLKNTAWLKAQGFTLLLAIRDERFPHVCGENAATELGIEAETFAVAQTQDFVSIGPRLIRTINDHISSSHTPVSNEWPYKKVLVFCETGNGYSGLALVAYLMVMLNLKLHQALAVVHAHRLSVEADEPSRQMLVSFESIIMAKRNVEEVRRATTEGAGLMVPPQTVCKKRSFTHRNEDEAMEDIMDMGADEDTASDRKPVAPFQDR
ncbi:putative dual specificity protein phosphatase 3 [Aspergillus nomiae NRRL 13137]|uniref:Putative dual specificity protein phosphatase 3 n=1 Tax=Aspergillus nomiae NRRL (strain ATCC 15546 / NRRL 13137 / CBS 260.88 / M93) TaxID=1509407 RepID=A0A0L1INC1_ASPN3|nr:putative dual specificity protein phosphatase 3 [Aspergillus nomiae NRRL 13137]KNG80987.1 putative dual specificity protein phosphatase 3 [Aspergillus nomiae NRRL 13137]